MPEIESVAPYLHHVEGDMMSWGKFREAQRNEFEDCRFRISERPIYRWIPLICNGDKYWIHPDDVLPYSWFKRSQILDRRDFKRVYNNRVD